MLRNSASRSVSPSLSSRTSPPITRSVSRLAQNVFSTTSNDQLTPKARKEPSNNSRYIKTVERHMEVGDDDGLDEEEEQDIQNSSRFVNSHHFTVKERVEMYFDDLSNWSEYSWRAFRRRFIPSWKTMKEWIIGFIMVAIMTKYVLDSINAGSPEKIQRQVDASLQRQDQKIDELMSRLEVLSHDLEDTRKLHGNRDDYSNEFLDKVGMLKEKISMLEEKISMLYSDIENVKTETKISTELVHQVEVKKLHEVQQPAHVAHQRRNLPGVNVANSLLGASIDERCSSHAVSAKDSIFFDMMSYVMTLKAGYVLLDRDVLQPGEAWCTYDNRATLTVKLARWITPTAISYQHVKWSGIVPNHAPKLYDVVACRSPCCTDNSPLALNCVYGQMEGNEDAQEQFCEVQENPNTEPVNHVQFRFRENHGNMTKTCAYLVRVYGQPVEMPPEKLAATSNHHETDVKSIISSYLPSIPYFEDQ